MTRTHQHLGFLAVLALLAACSGSSTSDDSESDSGLTCRSGDFYLNGKVFDDCDQCESSDCSFESSGSQTCTYPNGVQQCTFSGDVNAHCGNQVATIVISNGTASCGHPHTGAGGSGSGGSGFGGSGAVGTGGSTGGTGGSTGGAGGSLVVSGGTSAGGTGGVVSSGGASGTSGMGAGGTVNVGSDGSPLSCTTVSDAVNCTNGDVPEVDLGTLDAATCHDQCEVELGALGLGWGCWIVALDAHCYCRSGQLNEGDDYYGGACVFAQ